MGIGFRPSMLLFSYLFSLFLIIFLEHYIVEIPFPLVMPLHPISLDVKKYGLFVVTEHRG